MIDTSVLFGDPAVRLRLPVTLPTAPPATVTAHLAGVRLVSAARAGQRTVRGLARHEPLLRPGRARGRLVNAVDVGFRGAGAG